jgi:hypothetical protein
MADRNKEIERVGAGLDRAFKAADEDQLEIDDAKLIVFSDLHRGVRDGADDFLGCERAYHAALGYYLELGYRLILLGDVEELWENQPAESLSAYRRTLELETAFFEDKRLLRFWGNHDDQWRHEDEVKKHLHSRFPGLVVHEASKLRLMRAGNQVGLLFLVHGHQGTTNSDGFFAPFSKLVVRYVWRPIQRRTGMRSATPAVDWDLRASHDTAMYEWAKKRPEKLVLIAGHTHRPVFAESQPSRQPDRDPALVRGELDAQRGKTPPDPAAAAALRSELELIMTPRPGEPPRKVDPPCYFNSGCCCFGDGDATGLEIEGGEFRLVRWLDDDERPARKILAREKIDTVLDRVAGGG